MPALGQRPGKLKGNSSDTALYEFECQLVVTRCRFI